MTQTTKMTRARALAARAATCGAIVAGFAAGTLLGAGPANADTATPSSVTMVRVTNYTPYVWTLNGGGLQPGSQAPAPQTIEPGQTGVWDGDTSATQAGWLYTYKVTDEPVMGFQYEQSVRVSEANGLDSIEVSQGTPHRSQDSTFAHAQTDADGDRYHWDVYWHAPVTMHIDNSTDSAAATAAVDGQFPRAVAGSVKWTTTKGSEKWNWGAPTRATGMLYNDSSAPAKLMAGHETSVGQSANFGLEITGSVGTKVFGTSAKLAASVDVDKDWGSEDSVDVTDDADVQPHTVGWLDKKVQSGALTGELTFTTPEGITFDITNVTLTQGGLVDPDPAKSKIPTGVLYSPDSCATTDAACIAAH